MIQAEICPVHSESTPHQVCAGRGKFACREKLLFVLRRLQKGLQQGEALQENPPDGRPAAEWYKISIFPEVYFNQISALLIQDR